MAAISRAAISCNVHEGTLFAAPFDLERLEVTGEAVPALADVQSSPNSGGAQFAFSRTGTLVYLTGHNVGSVPIHWVNRDGQTTPLRSTPANWRNPAFSPDGRRLAIEINDGKQDDVWVYEWERDTLTRVTFDPADDRKPAWTPDGRRLTFDSNRGRKMHNLYWQRADGTGDAERLTESPYVQSSPVWHPSGKLLAYQEYHPETRKNDLMLLPIDGDEASGFKPGKPTTLLSGPSDALDPAFSPDGRWLAYGSQESQKLEVYVRPFPGPGGKWQVSNGVGALPTWFRTRPELLYWADSLRIMVVPYRVEGGAFRSEMPRPWSGGLVAPRGRGRAFDLHPDGQRLAAARIEDRLEWRRDKVVLVFNFFDELRRIAPPGTAK